MAQDKKTKTAKTSKNGASKKSSSPEAQQQGPGFGI